MSVTARQIVVKAMQKIGLLTKTEQPSSDEINDGFYALNSMLDSWTNESMLITARAWENFPLSAGVSLYTIGTGQTFNTVRPTFINDAYVIVSSTTTPSYQLTVIQDETYFDTTLKTQQGIPFELNYDNAYPSGNIRIYFVPDQAYMLYLLSEKPLTQFASLDTVVSMAPGWEIALIYNLAVLIAPEFGQEASAQTIQIATQAKKNVKNSIMRVRTMDAEWGQNNGKSVLSGQTGRGLL